MPDMSQLHEYREGCDVVHKEAGINPKPYGAFGCPVLCVTVKHAALMELLGMLRTTWHSGKARLGR